MRLMFGLIIPRPNGQLMMAPDPRRKSFLPLLNAPTFWISKLQRSIMEEMASNLELTTNCHLLGTDPNRSRILIDARLKLFIVVDVGRILGFTRFIPKFLLFALDAAKHQTMRCIVSGPALVMRTLTLLMSKPLRS